MLKTITKLFLVCLTFISVASYASDYTLSAGDTISISVYGEEDLTFENMVIDNRQNFDYPYLGSISTKGKTLKQVQVAIADGLRGDYLIDPKVTVSIVKYRNIYVNGVVNKPGAYEYEPELTVEKSIALAGGFLAKYRKTKGIYLTQENELEGMSQKQIQDFLKNKGEVELTEKVRPGDTIYVVSSFW
ncbi:polysaccharide export protein [Vibrio hannami]|uniref:polysaccharide biosynthesis/export family protein n=1 Tax=Vibrio hannami TaxID=2717094 RepID=UPI00240F4816|nr:polysaccharide biosynthesis/export family protein [Vibrio hannami]MDG3088260.1 polysaccharide export protein [Vibrio hannami]